MQAPPLGTAEEKELNGDSLPSSSLLPADGPDSSEDCARAYDRLTGQAGQQNNGRQTPDFRRILVTLCAVLSVLLVMEGLARAIVALGQPAQYGCTTFDVKKQLAQTLAFNNPTVLFLGSSLTMDGVYADLIEKEMKRGGSDVSVYNLACHNSYPLDQLFLLQNAIDHNTRPPALVVMEVNPLGFMMKPEFADEFSPMLKKAYAYSNVLTRKELLLGDSERRPDLLRGLTDWLNENSYLVRYRAYLKSQICAIPAMVSSPESVAVQARTAKVAADVSEHGYVPMYGFMNENAELKTALLTFPLRTEGDRHLDYGALRVVSSYCARRKIPLALLWLPWPDGTTKWACNFMGLTASEQLHSAIVRAADENKALLMDVHEQTDKLGFADCAHLNLVGSLKVSQRLAAMLSVPPFSQLFGGKN